MPIELKLIVEKTEKGKFNANIEFNSEDGKDHASISILQDSLVKAIGGAFEPILVIAPNLMQEEINSHYEIYP